MKRHAFYFCEETSLHGFRFITHPKSSRFKSIFWGAVCLISMCLCSVLIYMQIQSYSENRITTNIATTAFPISEVPFPAVTICNYNVVYKENLDHFQEMFERERIDSTISYSFLSNLSYLILNEKIKTRNFPVGDYSEIIGILSKNGYNTDKLMAKLAQPCDKLLRSCSWKTEEVECGRIFKLSKTSGGYCCSFNYRGLADLQPKGETIFGAGVGPLFGLEVHLNPEINQYFSQIRDNQGVDVLIHESIDYPDLSLYSTAVSPSKKVSLAIKPEVIESDSDLKSVAQFKRGCAFSDEFDNMNWALGYTYSNCIIECRTRAIIDLCGCIPFYYPMKGRARYCTLLDMECLNKKISQDYEDQYQTVPELIFTDQSTTIRNLLGDASYCKCLPQCNEVSYGYQNDEEPLINDSESDENSSVLNVYFSHVTCFKIRRSEFLTWQLILASIGGLIGLCLGGSILSVIEFFYHIIETIFRNYGSKQTVKKAKNEENESYSPKLYLTDFEKPTRVTFFKPSINSRVFYDN